ncbi:MAG: tRNA pseudouridine(38-40) synthase TruA [Parachlamydiaceae bacterium]
MLNQREKSGFYNIRLLLAYDGSNFLGWQKTSLGPSIEATLQRALEQILQHHVRLQAASRTDAGVHASGQVANFFTSKLLIDLNRFRLSINALLPPDIRVLEVFYAQANFHPTLDNVGKTYQYELCLGPIQHPRHRFYSWHIPQPLDIEKMRAAAGSFIGTHDFSAFCNVKKNENYLCKTRELQSINISELEVNRLRLLFTGNSFLYKMVRNLVGTLVYVGLGKIPPAEIPIILQGKDRTKAGMSAPAHGLTLVSVHYS